MLENFFSFRLVSDNTVRVRIHRQPGVNVRSSLCFMWLVLVFGFGFATRSAFSLNKKIASTLKLLL
jgi:hypothetical protein